MAENDTRVDALEDEVKVLKGEVRRTLVDLRALLMREDSPLNEGSSGRRSAPVDLDPNEGSPQSRVEVTETVRQGQGNVAGPARPDHPAPEPAAAAPNAPQPAYPGQGFGNVAPPYGGAGPGGMFAPPMGPQPGAGWPVPQAPPAPPPPPPPPQQVSSGLDPAMAERERRMTEQEQRMAEQERRIADQERNLANSERAQRGRDRNSTDEGRMQEMPPPTKQAAPDGPEQGRPSVEVDVAVGGTEQQDPRRRPVARVQTQEPGDSQAQEPSRPGRPAGGDSRLATEDAVVEQVTVRRPTGQARGLESDDDESEGLDPNLSSVPGPGEREVLPVYYDQDEQPDDPPPRRRRKEQDMDDAAQDSDHPVRRPPKAAARRQQARSENGHDSDGEDDGNRPLNRNGTGSRVYDEYFQLLSETEESHVQSVEGSPAEPMDINLVASLVRWASLAKQRVGEERLQDILELYLQSGHATPGLREVLTQVSRMADAMLPESNQTAQECVDLISHLHGILTGALTIVRVPRVKIPI